MQTTQNNYNYGKKFRKYTYSSIPISFCILALLTVGYGMVNPFLHSKTYAMEDNGVDTPTSRAVNPSAALTVNDTNLTTQTVPGEVAYLSSNITYSANDIESYSLKISYASGSNALKGDSSSASTITGAGGKTPASMSSNTWGYALADTNANNTTLAYSTMPAYGSAATIVSGNAESVPTTTKKLVFASKFAESATSGHYRTKVLLSLTATPKVVAGLDSITYMQEMTGEVCKQTPQKLKDQTIPTGGSKVLIDKRDNSTYTVARLEDGNCWMTQNLRIVNKVITSTDSDMASGSFTIPVSSPEFTNANKYSPQVYYENILANGAYYNWYTATAGSGTIATGTVSSSICPKNWKLPSNSGDGSFTDLLEHAGITNNQEGANKIQGAPYNFSRAGKFEDSSKMSDDYGFYWSNSAKGVLVINSARVSLFTGSISTDPNVNTSRVVGQSIRCVALGS